MKVLYDYQIFQHQKFGGISRYFFELLNQYSLQETLKWELPIQYSNNEYLRVIPQFADKLLDVPPPPGPRPNYYKQFMWGWHFKGKWQLYSLKNKLIPEPVPPPNLTEYNKELSIKKLKEGNFDIFHPTYYDDYFLEYIGDKPYVLTVYDMIHEIFPEYFLYGSDAEKKRQLVSNAAQVIAISESTKRDVVQLFGVSPEKVKVVYLGNSLQGRDAGENATTLISIPTKYLLFVGNRSLYKNFYFFITAIALLLEEDKDLYVVCTGGPLEEAEKAFFRKLELEDRIIQIFAADQNLAQLYQRAEAFVFPSLYEGFGIPVLEAFSCGCPVIVSNSSSLPEVGGEAVQYFEPKNAASLRKAVGEVLYNGQGRKELILKGYQQLAKFSWEKMATETREVYKNVILTNEGKSF